MRNNAFFLNYAQKHYVREYGFHLQVRIPELWPAMLIPDRNIGWLILSAVPCKIGLLEVKSELGN
jgi:hypothetical protein